MSTTAHNALGRIMLAAPPPPLRVGPPADVGREMEPGSVSESSLLIHHCRAGEFTVTATTHKHNEALIPHTQTHKHTCTPTLTVCRSVDALVYNLKWQQ